MKRTTLPLLGGRLLAGCQDRELPTVSPDVGSVAFNQGRPKSAVCHYNATTNSYELITIADPALPAHIAHGDNLPGSALPNHSAVLNDNCVLVAVVLGTEAQTVLIYGWNGVGSALVEVRCPDGSVAIGYDGRGGFFPDHVKLRCAPLLGDGTLGAWAATTDRLGTSNGGDPAAGMCPVVNGVQTVMVRDKGMLGGDVHHLRGYCLPLTEILNGTDNAAAPHITDGRIGGQHRDSEFYDFSCPNGYVVTGIFGGLDESAGYVRSIGYICRRVLLG